MAARNSVAGNRGGNDAITEAIGDDGRIEASQEETIFDPGSITVEQSDTTEYATNPDGSVKRNKDGSPRKKRGRKAGGTNAGKSKTGNNPLVTGIETLSQSLLVFHMGLASFSKYDGFNLDSNEAEALAKSTVHVMQEFDITPDPRFVAVTGLITTAGMIYGPRLYNYNEWRQEQRKKKQEEKIVQDHFSNAETNLTQFPGSFAG